MAELHCRYIFGFNSPEEQKYNLYFDYKEMTLLEKSFEGQTEESLEWAKLESHKCEHCPLSKDEHRYCPAAVALGKVAKKFAEVKSYTETKVAVVTGDRTYLKQTSTQEALHSIFGLIMATCGCPYLKFLRPMARFHLPFANSTETMVRSLSFYLLKQYFKLQGQSTEVFDLKTLINSYDQVQIVNKNLVERIRSLGKGDADLNAIVVLDSFAMLLSMQITDDFADLRPLFSD
jgi:hypothetical protein